MQAASGRISVLIPLITDPAKIVGGKLRASYIQRVHIVPATIEMSKDPAVIAVILPADTGNIIYFVAGALKQIIGQGSEIITASGSVLQ
jgi:hypothetical protein